MACFLLQVFYSDAKDITRLIEQITNGADSGSFNLVPKSPSRTGGGSFSTMHTTRTEDLPVEDQLDRLIQRVASSDSPQPR
jgi:serine/arginine repetitive matrix protein 2